MSSRTTPAGPIPILFIIHSLGHGGMERQVTMLARNMDRSRFQPHVAAVVDGFRGDELRKAGIPVISIPIRSFFDPGPLAISRDLRSYIRKHGIRLVHLFDAGLSLIALLSTRGNGVRLLTSQRFYMHLAKPSHRAMLIAAHWLADGIVVNSADTRRHLHDDYKYPLSRADVCYNGIDTTVFHPEPRKRLPELEDADLVIGCVCVLRWEKNLGILLRAFAAVRGSAAGTTKLLIMGSGPEEAALKSLARELGIENDCCFLPSAADVTAAMRSIDIFVHPSLTESLPNGVMEAMACGCCVISSRVGGCPELIEDGTHGYLVEATDLDGLVAKLRTAIASPETRQRMAQAASKRIVEEFSVPASVRRMEEIYEARLR